MGTRSRKSSTDTEPLESRSEASEEDEEEEEDAAEGGLGCEEGTYASSPAFITTK